MGGWHGHFLNWPIYCHSLQSDNLLLRYRWSAMRSPCNGGRQSPVPSLNHRNPQLNLWAQPFTCVFRVGMYQTTEPRILTGFGVRHRNSEFFVHSARMVFRLPMQARSSGKLAHWQRRPLKIGIVVWIVLPDPTFVSNCASAMLKWFKLWLTAGTEVTSPRDRNR